MLHVHLRRRESVAINSSLMTLGRCLEALHWNQQHKGAALKVVPYRESKVGVRGVWVGACCWKRDDGGVGVWGGCWW